MRIVDLSDENVEVIMSDFKNSIISVKKALDNQREIVDSIEIIYGKLDEVVRIIGKK